MPDSTASSLGLISDLWSDILVRRLQPGREGWFYAIDHPRVRARINGDALGGLDPFSWIRPRKPEPTRRVLEIGCGTGDLAIDLVLNGFCDSIDAFDVAEGAIAAGRARIEREGVAGVTLEVRDGNSLVLPSDTYDMVYASHALHHIENLENLFAQSAAALRPGGMLFASDYVGPSRMQYSDSHLALMNDMLARLPPEKRHDRFHGYREKRLIQRAPLQAFLDNDPSEAVRSASIIPALREHFDVQVIPYGMILTFEVLLGIVHNFDPDDPEDNALIDQLLELDRAAEQGGEADMLFACLVAHPLPPRTAVAMPAGPGFAGQLQRLQAARSIEGPVLHILSTDGSAAQTAAQLAEAATHLGAGIVVLDHAFDIGRPGVTEGLLQVLAYGNSLAAFAAMDGSMFLCRPTDHAGHLADAKSLLAVSDQASGSEAVSVQLAGYELLVFSPASFPHPASPGGRGEG